MILLGKNSLSAPSNAQKTKVDEFVFRYIHFSTTQTSIKLLLLENLQTPIKGLQSHEFTFGSKFNNYLSGDHIMAEKTITFQTAANLGKLYSFRKVWNWHSNTLTPRPVRIKYKIIFCAKTDTFRELQGCNWLGNSAIFPKSSKIQLQLRLCTRISTNSGFFGKILLKSDEESKKPPPS
jgi:hypothetical protein